MSNLCPQCGAPAEANATKCVYCGAALTQQAQTQAQPQVIVVQQPSADSQPERRNWPIKSKIVAGVLAILLGNFGIHKFYLGKPGAGILYILFCWTYIPGLIGWIEGIMC